MHTKENAADCCSAAHHRDAGLAFVLIHCSTDFGHVFLYDTTGESC